MMFKKYAAIGAVVAALVALPWALQDADQPELETENLLAGAVEVIPASLEKPASVERATPAIRSMADVRRIRSDRWKRALVDDDPMVSHWSAQPEFSNLKERRPLRKRPASDFRRMPADATGILIVKFRDEARVRMNRNLELISRTNRNVEPIDNFFRQLNVEIEPAFYRAESELAQIESRAAGHSGRAQPDLAGFFHLRGTEDQLVAAAEVLANSEMVEFVEFEREMRTGEQRSQGLRSEQRSHVAGGIATGTTEGACCYEEAPGCIDGIIQAACEQSGGTFHENATCEGGACGTIGACCIELPGNGTFGCVETDLGECRLLEGYFQGPSTICFDEDDAAVACEGFELDCGAQGTESCGVTTFGPFCEDGACCESVCSLDPFCCDEYDSNTGPTTRGPQRWDIWCVRHAQFFCNEDFAPPGTFPACFSNTSPCFQSHPQTGCGDAGCCNTVCNSMPECCSTGWSTACAALAADICLEKPSDETPDFTSLQGYLTPGGYVAELLAIPQAYVGTLPTYPATVDGQVMDYPLPGFGGEGYNLAGFEWFAQYLYDEYGIAENPDFPDQPTARGEGIRVGVVEHSAFVQSFDQDVNNHEALQHVISEPGQTVLAIPGTENLTGNHGTACLGIIGGREYLTGMAPEAELWFFPIVSGEEGGRLGRAMVSAMEEFSAGDVLSFSIGPGGAQTLATGERSWTLLRMASDLGITCVISAGNDCLNLDSSAQFDGEDSGVIIVGAVYPGRQAFFTDFENGTFLDGGNVHCRLPFSNFCQECEDANTIHISSWGSMVTTAGYGALHVGEADDPRLRSYTHVFNGTSAAAPLVAGVVARLQSLSKQFYGIPITPEQARDLIALNGFMHCGAPENEPDRVPGHDENACDGSWDYGETPDRVSRSDPHVAFTGMFALAESLVSSELYDCLPIHLGVYPVRGDYQQGNLFSICSAEGSFYTVRSMETLPNSGPSNAGSGFERELDKITYMASGQIADVLVVARPEYDVVTNIAVSAFMAPMMRDSIAFIEAFNWNTRTWTTLGANYAPAGGDEGGDEMEFISVAATFFNTGQYLRDSDNTILVRVWLYGFPGAGPYGDGVGNTPFEMNLDFVDITASGFFDSDD